MASWLLSVQLSRFLPSLLSVLSTHVLQINQLLPALRKPNLCMHPRGAQSSEPQAFAKVFYCTAEAGVCMFCHKQHQRLYHHHHYYYCCCCYNWWLSCSSRFPTYRGCALSHRIESTCGHYSCQYKNIIIIIIN